MKITNDYTTLENKFEGFDKEYQLYMLDILLDYLMSYGKNSISRLEIAQAMKTLTNAIQEENNKVVSLPKAKTLIKKVA